MVCYRVVRSDWYAPTGLSLESTKWKRGPPEHLERRAIYIMGFAAGLAAWRRPGLRAWRLLGSGCAVGGILAVARREGGEVGSAEDKTIAIVGECLRFLSEQGNRIRSVCSQLAAAY
jgi:hypothetical protein